ncbi:MAG: UvrB/UvrC motif-containing protein [Hydrogenibacillus sp.]|nr:UvrB/UvrC motif-containing protein [Hydrogenibacillus sp.]
MLCENCGKRSATFHFTKIVNGEKTEMHLCDACARERGEALSFPGDAFSIHHLLSGLMPSVQTPGTARPPERLACPTCGMTYEEFVKKSRFGCSDCYDAFKEPLGPLLKRIHGVAEHGGKVPRRAEPKRAMRHRLQQLRQALKAKVAAEAFEEAARIRDEIRALEQALGETKAE